MRSLKDTRQKWEAWKEVSSLQEVKEEVKFKEAPNPCLIDLRSVCWKVFLLFNSVDRAIWTTILTDSRDGYGALREHFLKDIEHPDEIESAADPLSDNQNSPWAVLRQDEDLRSEILQDVERCMQENVYFQQPSTQKMLLDVLFVFCKLNPDIGYRQGMHELLAPVLWVVEKDAIDPMTLSNPEGKMEANDTQLLHILDSKYIEHDTFSIFNRIMQNAKVFYEVKASNSNKSIQNLSHNKLQSGEAPIVAKSNRIFKEYLPCFDPGLAAHLEALNISPQIFLMKWIRLLFGREFPLDDVLLMWDVLFAEDPSLELVDMICVAMILRIRWQLLESDINTALDLLLHYPQQSPGQRPQSFVIDAIYLHQNMSPKDGNVIIRKYSGKAPILSQTHLGSRSDSHEQTTKSSANIITSNSEYGRASSGAGNLEYYLQDAARGLYARGQKLGIRKAVQDAVGEVRKNVQAITSPESEGRPRQVYYDRNISRPKDILRRVSALQERNKALAKMLSSAVDELWEYEKNLVTPEGNKSKVQTGKQELSATIAKVQFVQVFLEDPSLEVAATDTKDTAQDNSSSANSSYKHERSNAEQKEIVIETAHAKTAESISDRAEPDQNLVQDIHSPTTERSPYSDSQITFASAEPSLSRKPRTPVNLHASRPSLAQSSFSWMVKPDAEGSSFVAASPTPTERRRGKGSRGFLFGEDDEVKGEGSRSISSIGAKGERKPEVIGLDALK